MIWRRGLLLLIFLNLLGCMRGALVVDQYWDAVMRSRGQKPWRIANHYYLRYIVLEGNSREDFDDQIDVFVKNNKKWDHVIFSPWLGMLLDEGIQIPGTQGYMRGSRLSDMIDENAQIPAHWGVLRMHGMESVSFNALRNVKISRINILQRIGEDASQAEEGVLLIYSDEDDYLTLKSVLDEGYDFFSIALREESDIERSIEQAIAIMALREVSTLIVLAEPYNFAVLNSLASYVNESQKVYSTRALSGYKNLILLSDQVDEQIKALLRGSRYTIEVSLEH